MAYAFCLRLDSATEAAVAALWRGLVDGGAGDELLALGYPPHLSLAVLDSEPALAVIQAAFRAINTAEHVQVMLGGGYHFQGTQIVWLAVDGGVTLTALQHKLLTHLPTESVREHYRAAAWTPHVTLQMGGDVATALKRVEVVWPSARPARLERLEVLQFQPVRILGSAQLI